MTRREATKEANVQFCAHAMVAVGLEIGGLMVARNERDVDGATAFAAGLFREVTR